MIKNWTLLSVQDRYLFIRRFKWWVAKNRGFKAAYSLGKRPWVLMAFHNEALRLSTTLVAHIRNPLKGEKRLQMKRKGAEGVARFNLKSHLGHLTSAQQESLKSWLAAALSNSATVTGAWIENGFGVVLQNR